LTGKKEIEIEYSYSGAVALAADANYDFNTAIYELIDNSFAAKANNVKVVIQTNANNDVVAITIEDDGKGLPSSEVGQAFAPGTKKGDGINEHGVGMKAAISHFGELDECWSKTSKETWYLYELNPDDNGGKVEIDINAPDGKTGFSVQITCGIEGKAVYNKNYASNTPTIDSYKWGRRYADILSKASKNLSMVYLDEHGHEKKRIEVEPLYAEYDQHLVNGVEVNGSNHPFKAKLHVYKLRDKKEYNQYDPIKPTTASAGLDIVMHGRCVVERSKAPLNGILTDKGEPLDFSHPSYNRLYGRLIIESGIKSTPKKDNIQENDPAFKELQDLVAEVWESSGLKEQFKPDDSPDASEEDIELNLMDLLKEDDYTNIERQQRIDYGFRTDVQAEKDGEKTIWEVKKDQAVPNDVLQLVNYMRITGTPKGVLLADGFHGDCAAFRNLWGDEIEFWNLGSMTYRALKEVRS